MLRLLRLARRRLKQTADAYVRRLRDLLTVRPPRRPLPMRALPGASLPWTACTVWMRRSPGAWPSRTT